MISKLVAIQNNLQTMGSEMSFNAIRLDEVQSSKMSIGKSKFNKKSLIQAKRADTLKSGQFLRLSI